MFTVQCLQSFCFVWSSICFLTVDLDAKPRSRWQTSNIAPKKWTHFTTLLPIKFWKNDTSTCKSSIVACSKTPDGTRVQFRIKCLEGASLLLEGCCCTH